MTFRFFATPDFDFLSQFADHLQVPVHDNQLLIPEQLGQGYIRKLTFGDDFKIVIHQYVLKEELIIVRNSSGSGNDLITCFFYTNEEPLEIAYTNNALVRFSHQNDSAIQVTSNDLSSTVRFPARHRIHYVVIGIKAPRLKALLGVNKPNEILQTITTSGSSFLFFESMNGQTRLLLKNIAAVNMHDSLSGFYIQIKTQELLYQLLHTLSLRKTTAHQIINSSDAERLLYIRNKILSDLSTPPVIGQLAQIAAMSQTKLKQLFKQTFGSTIYTYYQQARMEEAAFLLKQGNRSVQQVGYELGFSNLGHFSRVFKKHYGLNPKRFLYA